MQAAVEGLGLLVGNNAESKANEMKTEIHEVMHNLCR